jgi:epoxyqueuosine reductase
MNIQATARKQRLIRMAADTGFMHCGVAVARRLDQESERLETWLKEGRHGEMHYMERHFDERLDPRRLMEGCRSVIVLLHNYFPDSAQACPDSAPCGSSAPSIGMHASSLGEPSSCEGTKFPKIARYAWGEDYHRVLKDKMRRLVERMKSEFGNFNCRIFTDSAPILEKSWAVLAGAGWIGKNTNLLQKQTGSYFFLSEILCDLDLEPDEPVQDHCGECTRCIAACPTQALEPYRLDASRCISYLTIELRRNIPQQFEKQMEGWAFGCDICQEVCPWNRFSKPHQEPRFNSMQDHWPGATEWLSMTEDEFEARFRQSPIARAGLEGMKKNIRFLTIP